MSTIRRVLFAALIPVLFTACSGLDIINPRTEDAVLVPDGEGRVTIEVSTVGWEIRSPGECGDREQCGHLVARMTADEKVNETTYNGVVCGMDPIELTSTTFQLDLHTCPRQTGLFSVLVHLHDDDHLSLEGGGVAAFRRFIIED